MSFCCARSPESLLAPCVAGFPRRKGSQRDRPSGSLQRKPPGNDGDSRRAEAFHSRALQISAAGKYSQAATLYRRALSLVDGHSSSDPLLLVTILNDFGVLSKFSGRFEQAKHLYDRAALLVPRRHPLSREFRATLYHNLAGLEHARGRCARALVHARYGLRLRRGLANASPASLAADEAALAAILVDLGRFCEARSIYRRVLSAYRRHYGMRHYETASLLANLGALYSRCGRIHAAESTLSLALSELEAVLGRNHPRLATGLNNFATVYAGRRKFAKAAQFYARALRLLNRQPGATYPSAAIVRANQKKMLAKWRKMQVKKSSRSF